MLKSWYNQKIEIYICNGVVIMALSQEKFYTEENYYNLPEDVRAELIENRIYYQPAPTEYL